MLAIIPLFPSIPTNRFSSLPCLALSSVINLITLAPEFWVKVLGITSSACPTALNGHYSIPSMFCETWERWWERCISIAPPPGTMNGLLTTFLPTPKASWIFLSTSFKTSFEAPLRQIEQAFGFLQFSKKDQYSSPISSTLNNPHYVPKSVSTISSGLWTIVAPVALASLLLSDFLALLSTVTFPFNKKCCARSETPFSVITMSGLWTRIKSHSFLISSSSYFKTAAKSSSLDISKFVYDSPFLYSRVQSSNITFGFSI